jgi:hypothetical protein
MSIWSCLWCDLAASFCSMFWMTIHAKFIQAEHPFLCNELILIFSHPCLCTPFVWLESFLWVPYSFLTAQGSNKWKHSIYGVSSKTIILVTTYVSG